MALLDLAELDVPVRSTAVAKALATWYAARPSVRCLWALAEEPTVAASTERAIRVIVKIEPSFDSDESSPVWLANHAAWKVELEDVAACAVRLEQVDDDAVPSTEEVELGHAGVLLAALTWRDPSASAG